MYNGSNLKTKQKEVRPFFCCRIYTFHVGVVTTWRLEPLLRIQIFVLLSLDTDESCFVAWKRKQNRKFEASP